MPRLSVWFIRASLVYLLVGFTWGALLLINRATNFFPQAWTLLPSHIELLFLGWFLQLGLGVAYWVFPRYLQGEPRGKNQPGWAAFILLNTGLVLSAAGSFLPFPLLSYAGHLLEAAATILLVGFIWRRVKPFRS